MCAHVNLCTCLMLIGYIPLFVVYVWLIVKDHEGNHSDYVQLKTQSGPLLFIDL